jgi:hypothetical protein
VDVSAVKASTVRRLLPLFTHGIDLSLPTDYTSTLIRLTSVR